jgi:hypothetical protein
MLDDEGSVTGKQVDHTPAPAEAPDPSIARENAFCIKELIDDVGFSKGFVYLFPFFDRYEL